MSPAPRGTAGGFLVNPAAVRSQVLLFPGRCRDAAAIRVGWSALMVTVDLVEEVEVVSLLCTLNKTNRAFIM